MKIVCALVALGLMCVSTEAAKLQFSHGLASSFGDSVSGLERDNHILPTTSLPSSSVKSKVDIERIDAFDAFIPGIRFQPPTFKSVDTVRNSGLPFSVGFQDFAIAEPQDRSDCVPGTVTATQMVTSIVPSTLHKYVTKKITATIPFKLSYTETVSVTETITNVLSRTHVLTSFTTSTFIVTDVQTALPATIVSTLTRTSVATVKADIYTTLTDTFIHTTTSHVTETKVKTAISTRTVPVVKTSYIYSPPETTKTFTNIVTSTVNYDRYLAPEISYVTETHQSTKTVTATQRLNPERIIKTTTIYVPSYSTIFSTHQVSRTKTSYVTIPISNVLTETLVHTETRVGLSLKTVYSTLKVTSTKHDVYTTTVASYVTVSETREVPIFTTRTTISFEPNYTEVIVPGNIVSRISTITSTVSRVVTVTNTLRTPVVYVTTTLAHDCIRKK